MLRRKTDALERAIQTIGLCAICAAVLAGGLIYIGLAVELAK